jgi:hypothetical protein
MGYSQWDDILVLKTWKFIIYSSIEGPGDVILSGGRWHRRTDTTWLHLCGIWKNTQTHRSREEQGGGRAWAWDMLVIVSKVSVSNTFPDHSHLYSTMTMVSSMLYAGKFLGYNLPFLKDLFWWYWGLNLGLCVARQVFYHLSHSSSLTVKFKCSHCKK